MVIMEKAAEILVVDDEPAVALAIKAALKFCGFAVVGVPNGEAALEQLRADLGRFPVVLSDHNMPGLGGLGFVQALRELGYPGGIVILSAFLSGEIESRYQALGVDQILSKPFDLRRLRGAIESLLEAQAQNAA